MKLIVGLGNPGKEYERTRHNAGFSTIDALADKLNFELDKDKFKSLYTIYKYKNDNIIFAKPQTYMNLSGEAVVALMNFYNISVDDLIVIHDDLDLPLGNIRLRYQGSSAGQKGMGNIIESLGTDKIKRIRIGISNDKTIDTKDYVLGKLSDEENKIFSSCVLKSADAIIYSFDHTFDETMTNFNS